MVNPLHIATQGYLSGQPISIATDGFYFIGGGGGQFVSAELATLLLTAPSPLRTAGAVHRVVGLSSSLFSTFEVSRAPGSITRSVFPYEGTFNYGGVTRNPGPVYREAGTYDGVFSPTLAQRYATAVKVVEAYNGLLSALAPGRSLAPVTRDVAEAVALFSATPPSYSNGKIISVNYAELVTTLIDSKFLVKININPITGTLSFDSHSALPLPLDVQAYLVSGLLRPQYNSTRVALQAASISGSFSPLQVNQSVKLTAYLAALQSQVQPVMRIPGGVTRLSDLATVLTSQQETTLRVTLQAALGELLTSAASVENTRTTHLDLATIPLLVFENIVFPHPIVRNVFNTELSASGHNAITRVSLQSASAEALVSGFNSTVYPGPVFRIPDDVSLAAGFIDITRIPGPTRRDVTATAALLTADHNTIVAVLLPSAVVLGTELFDFRIRNLKATDTLYVYRQKGAVYLYDASPKAVQMLKENKQLCQRLQTGNLPARLGDFYVKEVTAIDLQRKNAYILKDTKLTTQFGTINRKTV